MKVALIMVYLSLMLLDSSDQHQIPRVKTSLGTIVGTKRKSETGKETEKKTIHSFTGIPYMKPPVGQLRFKPPQPAESFTRVFSANRQNVACPQKMSGIYFGTEKCTVLNIHTPRDPSCEIQPGLPVMVFIHSGTFNSDSTTRNVTWLPDYFLEHDVVLVIIKFRLGVFGFLSTGDEEAPGNYGLLDQIEALKWVKNHISAFGGNPKQVTIFGQGAGATSVHYLMLSPLAKGLFHRAIMQSGTSLSPWARTDISREYATVLAERLGCPTSPSTKLLQCLRGKTTEELVNTDVIPYDERLSELIPAVWLPRIDRESESPFLPANPFQIMKSRDYGSVPLLIGNTKDEFVYEDSILPAINKKPGVFVNGWDYICEISMAMKQNMVSKEKSRELCKKIQEHYINPKGTYDEVTKQLSKIFRDMFVLAGTYKCIELMSDHSSVYSYLFSYGDNHWMDFFNPKMKLSDGMVLHMDDLLYLFKYEETKWSDAAPYKSMVDIITGAWTSFAKNGRPVISHLPVAWPRGNEGKYVDINSTSTVSQQSRREDMNFMNSIFSETLYRNNASAGNVKNHLLGISCLLLVFMLYVFSGGTILESL